jgi:hypothetical protein
LFRKPAGRRRRRRPWLSSTIDGPTKRFGEVAINVLSFQERSTHADRP